MKGDFSRSTFRPQKHYRAVRMQQGRVVLDADWNEMVDIANDQYTAALRNMIGRQGALGDGFKVTFPKKATTWIEEHAAASERSIPDLYLNAGQYYANGYSCTLAKNTSFQNQPYFPGAAKHKTDILMSEDSNQWLLYLDVWERHLTAIEDPDLAEPSLGGADTTTRTQMVWQAKLLPLKEWERLIPPRNISIQMKQAYASENELFRIEIHSGGDTRIQKDKDASETTRQGLKPPTWKWSRDNASIAFPLMDIKLAENSSRKKESHSLQLTLAADQRLQEQLCPGDCVELECDTWILNGVPGWIGRIDQVEASDKNGQQRLMITVSRRVTSDELALLRDRDQHSLVRRWDQKALKPKGNFHYYQIDKNRIKQDGRSLLEILIPVEQASVYRGDRVELSGMTEDRTWLEGQVQEVSAQGTYQKISVALDSPLPDEKTIENIKQPVQMRRWNDGANFYLYQVDKNRIRQDKNSQSLFEILVPEEQAFLDEGDRVELSGMTEGRTWLEGQVQEISTERKYQKIKITLDHPFGKIEQLVQMRWWNDGANFYLYQVDKNSIRQHGQSLFEILVPEEQASVYRGDRVELSGMTGDRTWLEGQVQEVSAQGTYQKISVALDSPLPDEKTIENIKQPVQMRRWNEDVNLMIPNESQSLGHGITVRFPPGRYQTGTYWLMPIRSGANQDSAKSITVPQAKSRHTFVPLALLTQQDTQWEIKDLRHRFLNLSDVSARLEALQTELQRTKADLERTKEKLAALQVETDIEDEEQEAEISTLESKTDGASASLDQLHESVETLESKIGGYISRFFVTAWLIPLALGIGLLLAYLIFAQGNRSQLAAASQQATANAMQTALAQNAAAIQQANQTTIAQQAIANSIQTTIAHDEATIQRANQTVEAQHAAAIQAANQTIEAQQAGINAIQTAVLALQTAIPTLRPSVALNPTSTDTVAVVMGNGSGTAFTKSCPPNFVATGFSVWTENFVNAIQLWCSPLFEDSTIGGSSAVESFIGRLSGKEARLTCHPNMMIAGISGHSGETTDKLQVHCASLDGVQKQDLQEVGGSGGNAFSQKKCPDNFVMTGITGRANARDLTGLNMICTAYVTK